MRHVLNDDHVPRGALIGAAAVILFTLTAATAARLGGAGEPSRPAGPAVEQRELRFADRDDGAIEVTEAGDGRLVEVVAPGSNGFLRGAMRGLARERKRREIGAEPPFRLTRWADGRLTLEDPSTDNWLYLEAFGPTNAGVFARLLEDGGEARSAAR